MIHVQVISGGNGVSHDKQHKQTLLGLKPFHRSTNGGGAIYLNCKNGTFSNNGSIFANGNDRFLL